MKKLYANLSGRALLTLYFSIQLIFAALVLPADGQAVFASSRQSANDSGRYATAYVHAVPVEINSFANLDIPQEMTMHLRAMSPEDIYKMHEEFQVTATDSEGSPEIVTMKLWFANNHIQGYVFYTPLEKARDVFESQVFINVPVQWRCTAAKKSHGQHSVTTFAAMQASEYDFKCTGWQLYLPPFPPPPPKPVIAKERKKKGKKGDIANIQLMAAFLM